MHAIIQCRGKLDQISETSAVCLLRWAAPSPRCKEEQHFPTERRLDGGQ